MAFNPKYRVTFKDVENVTWHINIEYDPWAGGITELQPGVNPAIIRYICSDKYQTIVGSSLTMNLVYESALDDLFVEADQVVRIRVDNSSDNVWYGFLVPRGAVECLS